MNNLKLIQHKIEYFLGNHPFLFTIIFIAMTAAPIFVFGDPLAAPVCN